MKIPKTFTPERSLDKKVEDLNKSLSEKVLTTEEFKRNNMKIFYCNIDEEATSELYSNEMKREIINLAMDRILKDTYKGLIRWKQDLEDPEKYTANATILNANKEEITIPILFRTDDRLETGFMVRFAYLHLGDENRPCRNTYDPKIDEFASKYLGIDLRKKKDLPDKNENT